MRENDVKVTREREIKEEECVCNCVQVRKKRERKDFDQFPTVGLSLDGLQLPRNVVIGNCKRKIQNNANRSLILLRKN